MMRLPTAWQYRAMEQYAAVLCGMNTRLYTVSDPEGLSDADETSGHSRLAARQAVGPISLISPVTGR